MNAAPVRLDAYSDRAVAKREKDLTARVNGLEREVRELGPQVVALTAGAAATRAEIAAARQLESDAIADHAVGRGERAAIDRQASEIQRLQTVLADQERRDAVLTDRLAGKTRDLETAREELADVERSRKIAAAIATVEQAGKDLPALLDRLFRLLAAAGTAHRELRELGEPPVNPNFLRAPWERHISTAVGGSYSTVHEKFLDPFYRG